MFNLFTFGKHYDHFLQSKQRNGKKVPQFLRLFFFGLNKQIWNKHICIKGTQIRIFQFKTMSLLIERLDIYFSKDNLRVFVITECGKKLDDLIPCKNEVLESIVTATHIEIEESGKFKFMNK